MEIYCFSGKLGTGKNFVSEKIFIPMLKEKNTLCVALADHFKIESIVKDGLEFEKVYGDKDEYTRKKLQLRGTEEGRNIYGENIWVDILKNWIRLHESRGIERFIISDIRFPNEFDLFKEMGAKMFRVVAPKRNQQKLQQEAVKNNVSIESISNHISETALDDPKYLTKFDYIIRNDEFENPVRVIRDIVLNDINKKYDFKTTIFCDLDDTIIHCNKYYLDVISKFKSVLKSVYVNHQYNLNLIDELFERKIYSHNTGVYFLTHFTKTKFAESMVETVQDVHNEYPLDNEDQLTSLKNIAYNFGMNVFNYKYEAIEGSLEAFHNLSKHYNVVIFTVGDKTEQLKKMMELGIFDFKMEVFDHKDSTIFRYMMDKYKSKNYIMIGDSYERDVLPAIQSGIDTIYHISNNYNNPTNYVGYIKTSNLNEVSELIKINHQPITI